MQAVTTIGLDIAKSVFQVHGVDAAGPVLLTPGPSDQDATSRPDRARTKAALDKEQIVEFDRMIMVWHRSNETSKRLH